MGEFPEKIIWESSTVGTEKNIQWTIVHMKASNTKQPVKTCFTCQQQNSNSNKHVETTYGRQQLIIQTRTNFK